MKKLTVATRLGLGFSVVVTLLILVAGIGVARLAQLDEITRLIANDRWVKAKMIHEVVNQTSQIAISLRNMMLTDKPEDMLKQKEHVLDSRRMIASVIEKLEPLVTLPHGKEILGKVLTQRSLYIAGQEKLIALIESGSAEESRQYLNHELRPVLATYQGALRDFGNFQAELVTSASESARESYVYGRNLSLAVVLLSLAIAGWFSFWIIRSVTGPLGGEPDDAKAVVERIAQGDLTADIQVRKGDQTSLMAATARMQASLNKMVNDLKNNAESVSAAAHQLSTTSSQVAAATEEQSSSSSAMAAAVEEMTVSISHVSESAREANIVTSETGRLSQEGNRIIDAMAEEMKTIAQTVGDAAGRITAMGENSQKISGIVQVIKEVAEQTNLLALNAAIEAARAGEQGRGFAVVADEVRKLAERTAKATKEISNMIGGVQGSAEAAVGTMQQAVSRVELGVGMAQQANESMLGISNGAQRVVSAVNEISHALKEQSVASNDIAVNVERIAHVSEENSAATRETADTARRLELLAADTRQAVSRFRV